MCVPSWGHGCRSLGPPVPAHCSASRGRATFRSENAPTRIREAEGTPESAPSPAEAGPVPRFTVSHLENQGPPSDSSADGGPSTSASVLLGGPVTSHRIPSPRTGFSLPSASSERQVPRVLPPCLHKERDWNPPARFTPRMASALPHVWSVELQLLRAAQHS